MTLTEIEQTITDSLDNAQKHLEDMEIYGDLRMEYKLCQESLPYSHRLTLFHDNMEVVGCEYMLDKSFAADISVKEQLTIEKFVKNYMLDLLSARDVLSMVKERNAYGTFIMYTLLESMRK